MKQHPTTSVAMATYNGQKYLSEQLTSIAAQSRHVDELVITDDRSTDQTLEIIERFARTSPFPVQVHKNPKRLGYSRNFETAVAGCRGEVILLADQDDVWFPDKVETVCAEFQDPGVMVVLHNQLITDAALNHHEITMLDNVRKLGKTSDSLIEGCCTAFRRSWGELVLPIPGEGQAGIEPGDLSHDRWLNELSLLLGVRVFLERPLQYFRRHHANVTHWIANNPNGVRLADLIAVRQSRPPVDAWLRRTKVLDLYQEWLTAHLGDIEGIGVYGVEGAIAELTLERRCHEGRAALVQLPLPQRLPRIWRLWASGGYRYFCGWKSAIRDLTRRT